MLGVARAQHRAYQRALAEAGCTIVQVEAAPDMPDAVFVEDAAVVFDEVAIVTRPGAASRRAETAAVAGASDAIVLCGSSTRRRPSTAATC